MCKKCRLHSRYWVHMVDNLTEKEKKELIRYLQTGEVEA